MGLLLGSSAWAFGLQELIHSIVAFLTLAAIITSLYLATKSKTLRYKLYSKRLGKDYLQKKGMFKIVILNNGHIQFTITSIGFVIAKKFYYCTYNRYLKKLEEPRIEIKPNGSKTTHNADISILPAYLQEGRCLELLLYPRDYNFVDSKKNKKVYFFVMINNKIKKKYSGMRENEFYEIVKNNAKQKSHNWQAGDENPKSPLDLFFRC